MTPTKTQSDQLDEAQDSWISNNTSKNMQVILDELRELAHNLNNVSTGEIAGIVQSQNFEETLSTLVVSKSPVNLNYIQFNPPVKQYRESTYAFFRTDLDARTSTYCEQTSKVLLDKLLDMGFAWIHIAKMIHTPVYIVRDLACDKDNCKKLSKESHAKLAQLLALIKIFEERFPDRNIPSWLETTLDGYYYSGIDVIAEDQIELLVSYAYKEITNIELLNKCFPNWEDNFDSRIEAFTASDGETAIRLRNDNLED